MSDTPTCQYCARDAGGQIDARPGMHQICDRHYKSAVCPDCHPEVKDLNTVWLRCQPHRDEHRHGKAVAKRLEFLRADADAKTQIRADSAPEWPKISTLAERLALPKRPTEWRVRGLQQIGHRVIAAAKFKRGKTTLLGNLNRSLLDGDPFLDHFEVSPVEGAIALFDLEMAEEDRGQLDDWYEALGIRNADRLVVVPLRGRGAALDILTPEGRGRWAAELKRRGVTYAELDCARPALDAHGLDENHEAGVYLAAFDALLTEAGIREAILLHHFGHTAERSRGDSRLLDWPDVNWNLTTKGDDPGEDRLFDAFGRGVCVPKTTLAFNPITNRLAVAESQAPEARPRDAVKEATLAVLPEWPDKKSVRQLLPAVQAWANAGSYASVAKACHQLKREGRAEAGAGRAKGYETWGRPKVSAAVGPVQAEIREPGGDDDTPF